MSTYVFVHTIYLFPQFGGIVIAASRKIRRRWMKRHRVNTPAVSLQRGDACRSTAIRV